MMATDTVANSENFHLINGDEDVICPTCDVKIKLSQVADHCQVEVDRLHRMQLRSANASATATTNNSTSTASDATTTTATQSGNNVADTGSRRRPWSVFQRVQRNRQARQRQRTRRRPTPPLAHAAVPPQAADTTCPVCSKNYPQAEIQRHVNQCLRNSRRKESTNGERYSSDDDDGSDDGDEYEWAGQKRVRVSTLVDGGYSALALGHTIKYNGSQQAHDDEDEDLNVDEDDTHIYGPTQYDEVDVIPVPNEGSDVSEEEVTSYVRRLISSNDPVKATHSNDMNKIPAAAKVQQTNETAKDAEFLAASTSQAPSTSRASRNAQAQHQVIESLKAKLRSYEAQVQNKIKCLICIDDYKNPAISVSCWHVHCEQCWLQTLGARKLCPQCNSITSPKDLRRIYL